MPDDRPVPTSEPESSLGFLLNDVSRLLRRDFDRRARELGLTQAQWRALAHLSRQEGINQATLAELIEIQPITLTRLVDRMQAAGWVERRPDPADRRAVRLYLTPKAQPLIDRLWALAAETRALALGDLPEGTREQLLATLRTLKENLLAAERSGAGGEEEDADSRRAGQR